MKIKRISKCRCCKSKKLKKFLDFGKMSLTTEFPKSSNSSKKIPMELIICSNCKLFQLRHNYELKKLYNEDYGYKSGINKSMHSHLEDIAKQVEKKVILKNKDIILDIASNDGTLLKKYKNRKVIKFGIDPTIKKFQKYYPKNYLKFPGFFEKNIYNKITNYKKSKIITSIAVFYDLQNPVKFIKDIKSILDNEGIWVLEQSYFPLLIKNNAYDSICHEHLSYFMHKQLNFLLKKEKLKIIDVSFNNMNGGSVRFFISHQDSQYKVDSKNLSKVLNIENKIFSNFNKTKNQFRKNIINSKKKLIFLINKLNKKNKIIHIYGASTKGNVIIQFCGLTKKMIPYAVERNPEKFGRYTPGSFIPIISEKRSRALNPDFFLVMPWHFKKEIVSREKLFLNKGGKLIFPLPNIQMVSKK